MQDVACPYCGEGTQFDRLITCRDRLSQESKVEYRLVKCSTCDLIYLNPRPSIEDAGEFYEHDSYDPFLSLKEPRNLIERAYSTARVFTSRWKRKLVDNILSHKNHINNDSNSVRVLDVGCGTGEFLSTLSGSYYVEGIEPEPRAAQWAREKLGISVHTGFLAETSLMHNRYDLVTLWHVLEHVPDPIGELSRIRRLLPDDGKLLLGLPNIDSVDAGIYGPDWVALDAPRHLWHFTPSTLENLARKSGLSLVNKGMLPLDTFYNSIMSEQIRMRTRMPSYQLIAPFHLITAIALSTISGIISSNHSGMYYIFKKSA